MLTKLWNWLTQRREPLATQLTQIIEQEAAAEEPVKAPVKKPRKKKQ